MNGSGRHNVDLACTQFKRTHRNKNHAFTCFIKLDVELFFQQYNFVIGFDADSDLLDAVVSAEQGDGHLQGFVFA